MEIITKEKRTTTTKVNTMITFMVNVAIFTEVNMTIVTKVNMIKIIVVDMAIINEVNILMTFTFSSMSSIESGKQLLPVGVATRELRREFASSIT